MLVTAQQVFRELESGAFRPFYLMVGEEPYQAGEIERNLKEFFLKKKSETSFNYDSYDGEHLDAGALLASLETLPGLFEEEASTRFVVCRHFEKLNAHALDVLDTYFRNPSQLTCFVMSAAKVDKRKSWFKHLDEKGCVIEVNEPYEREWPKWHGYFEKKIAKRIAPEAWELLVEGAGRILSLLWADLQTAAIYVGASSLITKKDVLDLLINGVSTNVFDFAEDVLSRRPLEAVEKYHQLLQSGESEVKLLSILVRQFRLVEQALSLSRKGITDPKALAPQLGISPFFVPKILQQLKHHNTKSLNAAIERLAECDYQLKRGQGGVFERFLVGYFSGKRIRR